MKVIAFGASTSETSINKEFAKWAAASLPNAEVTVLDLNEYPLPMFSVNVEKQEGIALPAEKFIADLQTADFLVVSIAEHNGAYTAAFKNLFDWSTRKELKFFAEIPMLLLSTSTGARGGLTALEIAAQRFPIHGGNIKAKFSLPSFNNNFKVGEGITNEELAADFKQVVSQIEF